MLAYEDAASVIPWLCNAFGFVEREEARYADDRGVVGHAELQLGENSVMLSTPNEHYRGPRKHAAQCEQSARWLDNPWVVDGVFVEVDDVDAHHTHAVARGATV